MNLQLASFSSLLQLSYTFMQRFMALALAGLLVSLVSAGPASQPRKKSTLVLYRERSDLCR
jgi:hypothetical protein